MLDFLFKRQKSKDTEPVPQTETAQPSSVENVTAEQVKTVLDEIRAKTLRQVINISLEDGEDLPIDASKFGGIPYIPHDGQTPVDSSGRQLRLLAQINLSQLPKNEILPSVGIMQFWALDNDSTGLDFENNCSNDTSRVTYFDKIDESVSADEIKAKYKPWCEDDEYFPIQNEFALKFSLGEEGISSGDCAFNEMFVKAWNEKYPKCPINNVFDLPEDSMEDPYNAISGFGHKIGGYPGFTQDDPRDVGDEHSLLLIQIDSVGTDEHEIMWGDCGIANFFISPDALDKRDLSGVLYNWDCC